MCSITSSAVTRSNVPASNGSAAVSSSRTRSNPRPRQKRTASSVGVDPHRPCRSGRVGEHRAGAAADVEDPLGRARAAGSAGPGGRSRIRRRPRNHQWRSSISRTPRRSALHLRGGAEAPRRASLARSRESAACLARRAGKVDPLPHAHDRRRVRGTSSAARSSRPRRAGSGARPSRRFGSSTSAPGHQLGVDEEVVGLDRDLVEDLAAEELEGAVHVADAHAEEDADDRL